MSYKPRRVAVFMVLVLATAIPFSLYLWAQQTPMNAVALTNSTVDSSPVGSKVPSTGNFTNATATGSMTAPTFNGSLNGNATTATTATNAQHVPWTGVTGPPPVTTWNWQWAGQGGQPSWLWGSNDGLLMQVYNPSNFSVSSAVTAGTANVANSANSVAWANVSGKPYPVTASQTWNWSPQASQTYVWGTPDGNNMYPYNPANFNVNHSTSTDNIPWTGVSGKPVVTTWNWAYSGQPAGNPTWLWGTNDGTNMYVWNPINMTVANAAHATNADNATHATNADAAAQVTGLQMFKTGATCITSTASNAECNTTFNLPVQYPDTAYLVYCTPGTRANGQPVIQDVHPLSTSQFQVTIRNNQANPSSPGSYWSSLTCFAERHLTGS